MAEEVQPAEIIGIVDSILNGVSNVNEESPIESQTFFAHEDYNWLNSFVKALEKRTYQSVVTESLADARKDILNSEHRAKDFFTTVVNCKKCPNAISSPMVFEGVRTESKISFLLPYYTPELSDKTQNLIRDSFDTKEISLHYMVKCRTEGFKTEDYNIANCSPYLFSELQFFKSQVIVLMGKQVAQLFFPNIDSLDKWRGEVHYLGSYPFVMTMHPQDRSLDTDIGVDKLQADLGLVKSLL